jgi:membrane protein implicated in regulation of membrane protease activity
MIFGLSIKLLAGLTILLAAGFIPALTVSAVLVLLGASFNLGWGYAIIYLVILLSNVTDIARMMEERKHREYIAAGKP